jgi:hypothetical protein
MSLKNLELKVARLTRELEQEREKTAALERQIAGMKSQEVSMAALFRHSQPTKEGRIAHAQVTDHCIKKREE